LPLPAGAGFTYNIRPGYHFVDSRDDFPFIIITTDTDTPGVLKAGNHPLDNLKVTTGTARDTDGRVILERIATDSMRVTIKMVNENITITVTSGTPDGIKTVDGAKVWSYGGELNLYSPTSGTAQVYSLTGQLVKKLTYTAGETVTQPLARGIYIVRIDGKTWKMIIN
ncbi:MAG: T9SS type A sorting domain-containing protein, partial [Tannerella sp.]|nr:T9SS type A sorting domain-containing protein [Tannerella sp.]